jgi:hypothetical protein
MKALALMLLIISTSIICVLNISPVFALEQDDISISPSWSAIKFYQGDAVSVKLILSNKSPEPVSIYYLGIHFDWMEADSFHGRDLSSDPITVDAQDVYVFQPMAITIPTDVNVGLHDYTLAVEGIEGESTTSFSWDSQPRDIYIQHAKNKVFDALLSNLTSMLNENVTYQSSQAQSLIEQAENEYAQAVTLSYSDQWDDAITHLQNAVDYVEQAEDAEQQATVQNVELQRLLIIIAPIATAVIVSIIVILVWHRRTKPPTEEDQTQEPQETQDDTPEE